MKKTHILLISLLLACALAGCKRGETFSIAGTISGGADTIIYLEQLTLDKGPVTLDSMRVGKDEAFRFEHEATPAPEFYRLRIGHQAINLCIEGTEEVRITAPADSMSFGYTVEGSGVCDTMRLLCLRLADMERKARRISIDRRYTLAERDSLIGQLITEYKDGIKTDFIQGHYHRPYSYYACFQTLGSSLIFNPMQDKSDLTWMRAVANAWAEHYPGCPRTENICNIVMEGRKSQRPPQEVVLEIDSDKVRELGIIDMTFPDINGEERTLSGLKGQVVLLDFMAFTMDGSTERTLLLRELYNKYHTRGLEIYQVSVDPSQHLWKQRCEALPWVSVWCEEGLESDMLALYNVAHLPCFFLIDRNLDLQARQEAITDLEQAIEELL